MSGLKIDHLGIIVADLEYVRSNPESGHNWVYGKPLV